ncbi:MAG: ATP synthase F1 subunit epsilon [Ignavibacteria bacterium]|nr:ATP synthase F1 subunit epsilon [Ignavibacteria bacterium]
MSDKNFTLDIVTPTRIVYTGKISSISAPGICGGFQVLFNHAALLSQVGIGEMKLTNQDNNEVHFATSGGFFEVNNNKVIFLSETAEPKNEIDLKRAEESLRRADKRINEKVGIDIARAHSAFQRAKNRIQVATK